MTDVIDAAIDAFHLEDDLWALALDPENPKAVIVTRGGERRFWFDNPVKAGAVLQKEATRAAIGSAFAAMSGKTDQSAPPKPSLPPRAVYRGNKWKGKRR